MESAREKRKQLKNPEGAESLEHLPGYFQVNALQYGNLEKALSMGLKEAGGVRPVAATGCSFAMR